MDMTGSGYSDLHLVDATTGAREGASDDAADNFVEMFDGYQSTGDLFELVRRGGGHRSMEVQPAVSGVTMSPPQVPEVLPQPPSEEDMAAWLHPVVRGEEFVAGHPRGNGGVAASLMAVGDQQVQSKDPSKRSTDKGATSNSRDRRETAGARRSRYSETHRLTEKRRRCKVNERFKTLQQLVPGCDKCNQASTLDQTIQYMKSLQQQAQSMSSVVCYSMRPATEAAVYPLAPPIYIQPTAGAIAPRPPMLPPASCCCSCRDGDVCRAAPSRNDAETVAETGPRPGGLGPGLEDLFLH